MDFINLVKTVAKNTSKTQEAGDILLDIDFKVAKSKDLMTRGHSFYGVWDERRHIWSKNEMEVPEIIDAIVLEAVKAEEAKGQTVHYSLAQNYKSGVWSRYTSFIKLMPDNWKPLDNKIYFANDELTRGSYATHKLPYALESGEYPNYENLISVLYSPDEREKLEWSVGAILTGDSRHIQKFIVLYGEAGSGKSTFLNIVQKLIEGYYISFNAKELVGNNSFATEVFRNNPLVAIQHDGDLSKIEDNSTLNSIISHEEIVINEKHKTQYSAKINCFLYLGTNKPVKIPDSKSGLLRRLIDVRPSGKKVTKSEYDKLVSGIDFELGAIAHHCISVYKKMGEDYYRSYRPKEMMFETNTVFNFIEENFLVLKREPFITLKQLYDMYKEFCNETGETYPLKRGMFRGDMMAYFDMFKETHKAGDKQYRSCYIGFKSDLIDGKDRIPVEDCDEEIPEWLSFDSSESLLDQEFKDLPAQYCREETEAPRVKWANCTTTLKDLDPHQLHYISGVPENHIVVDFDLKNEKGEKDEELNLKAASKWPKTYGEYSKSGKGIHLHYIYSGESLDLSRIYSDGIEIKVFTGNASLRRKLTKCNSEKITTISSGLPLRERKGGDGVLDKKTVEDENHLRVMIKKCLNKEFHGATKPECDFIFKLLDEAYKSGMVYDVTDMRNAIFNFAIQSSNQSAYCIGLVNKMKFASDVESIPNVAPDELVFFDVEVFKNLFLICYKMKGSTDVISLVNPTPQEVGELFKFKLVGFNNYRYDNHILYGRYIGYTNEQLYNLSMRIISKEGSVKSGFREAYNISYTDIYDFSSSKQSLKKWEIELGLHHQEFPFKFDEDLPEQYWPLCQEYCANDVLATEALFHHLQADFLAREILADLAGGTPNMTTNTLVTRIVFGEDRNPTLQYTHLEEVFPGYEFVRGADNKMHNMYRGVDVSMGGYVYAEPGIYTDTAILDVQSMHPTSIIEMNYFGKYTKNYADIKAARIAIKHKDYEAAKQMLGGKLSPYLTDSSKADGLAYALKIALNSAYGLTSASFPNVMKHKDNINNIVALRGALFMKTLQDEVQTRGFTVVHIKTDSIKIAHATPEIIDFCKEFAKKYGYVFEHEATYEKICLVNNAVYIAKYAWSAKPKEIGKWVAVGAQFAEPYLFKKLFSKEPIVFEDYEQVQSVTSPSVIFLDFNENLPEGEHNYVHVGKVGSFVPVVAGSGGGCLYRETDGSYFALSGTKGYRWKESEIVKSLDKEDDIDISYFKILADKGIRTIQKFGPLETLLDDYENPDAPNDSNEDLIGFDDYPHQPTIAQAIQEGVK